MKRNLTLRHFNHARAIGMAAGDRRAEIGQTGRNYCSHISCAIDADLHYSSDGWDKTRRPYLFIYASDQRMGRVREAQCMTRKRTGNDQVCYWWVGSLRR